MNKRFIHLISPDSSSANISVLIIRFFHRDQNQTRYSCCFKTAAARLQNTHWVTGSERAPHRVKIKVPQIRVPAGEAAYIYLHKDPKNDLVNIQAFFSSGLWFIIKSLFWITKSEHWQTHTQNPVNVFTKILFIQRLHHLFSPDKKQRPLHM